MGDPGVLVKIKASEDEQYGFHESGNTSRRGGLWAATNSFSTGTSPLLASFTSLSLTPLQREGPTLGLEMLQ